MTTPWKGGVSAMERFAMGFSENTSVDNLASPSSGTAFRPGPFPAPPLRSDGDGARAPGDLDLMITAHTAPILLILLIHRR
jgi:hypothetical protein